MLRFECAGVGAMRAGVAPARFRKHRQEHRADAAGEDHRPSRQPAPSPAFHRKNAASVDPPCATYAASATRRAERPCAARRWAVWSVPPEVDRRTGPQCGRRSRAPCRRAVRPASTGITDAREIVGADEVELQAERSEQEPQQQEPASPMKIDGGGEVVAKEPEAHPDRRGRATRRGSRPGSPRSRTCRSRRSPSTPAATPSMLSSRFTAFVTATTHPTVMQQVEDGTLSSRLGCRRPTAPGRPRTRSELQRWVRRRRTSSTRPTRASATAPSTSTSSCSLLAGRQRQRHARARRRWQGRRGRAWRAVEASSLGRSMTPARWAEPCGDRRERKRRRERDAEREGVPKRRFTARRPLDRARARTRPRPPGCRRATASAPARERVELRRVGDPALHVLEALLVGLVVGDVDDLASDEPGQLDDALGELVDRDLVRRADVEHLADGARVRRAARAARATVSSDVAEAAASARRRRRP